MQAQYRILLQEDGADREGEQQLREGQEEVHQPADHRVDPAAEVAGGDAQDGADADRHDGGEERDEQRDAGTGDDAAEDVAAEHRVGSEQVVGVDAPEAALGRGQRRVDEVLVELVRRVPEGLDQQRREDRDQQQ